MGKKPFMKTINRAVTLLLWVTSFYLALSKGSWYLLAFILALHTAEVFVIGCKTGIKAGYSMAYSVIMTLIWGFTWWLYVDKRN